MNTTWTKRLLLVAATWNLLGGASALLDPAQHFAQMYASALALEDPLQLFFYRTTWINVMAWGAAYLLAAWLPLSRSAVLAAGAGGKLMYFAACVALFSSGAGTAMLLATGFVDLVFVLLFTLALVSRRRANVLDGRLPHRA